MTVSGIGGSATFQSRQDHHMDGRSVSSAVYAFVSVPSGEVSPDDPSSLPFVAVAVTQTDEETGESLFAGQGLSTTIDFQMDADLGHAHLQAEFAVVSATGDDTRTITLNIVWNPDDASEALKTTEHQAEQGNVQIERHNATVRRMSATGVIQVSDPEIDGHVITLHSELPASAWNSVSSGIRVTRHVPGGPGSNIFTQTAALATSTTCGSWSGYWTWDTVNRRWFWTWVWMSCGGSWTVS